MVNFKIGDRIRLCASIRDFCSSVSNFYIVNDINCSLGTCNITSVPFTCLPGNGQTVQFYWVASPGFDIGDCRSSIILKSLGSAVTDTSGISSMQYEITQNDLDLYNANNLSFDLMACIVESPTRSKLRRYTTVHTGDNIIIQSTPAPTHYISLSMGFVPLELIGYFETYISAISDNLMTKMAPPPAPWVYVKTTYDRLTNSFNIWLYLPPTAVLSMSPGALQDIYDFFAAWAPLVTGIMLILIAAFGPFGLFADLVLLSAGLVILAWKVFDATSNQILAETKATNVTIQIEQNNKEDLARSSAEDTWVKSAKTHADCITRLQSHRDVHLSKLEGYIDQYAKYPGLVTELSTMRDTFTANANSIITEFKASSANCDTYFVRLNSEIGTSNVAINDSLGRYIIPGETYSVACKGWTNQAACEQAECFWYDGACHKEEACWIPNPVGGCVLSARTGMIIIGTVALFGIVGVAYWVATRHPGEARTIITGAREAVREEAVRARAAYRTMAPPRIPGTVTG